MKVGQKVQVTFRGDTLSKNLFDLDDNNSIILEIKSIEDYNGQIFLKFEKNLFGAETSLALYSDYYTIREITG